LSSADWLSISPRRLLFLAAVLHIVLTVVITLVGKSRIVPHTFDTNGIGIAFALDSASYREEASQMAAMLRAGKFREWANYETQLATFHVRLYSISYALFGKVLGEGVLAAEPINLIYYLAIVVLTYLIGGVVFSWSVGRASAVVVGLWPSLLMFSTQLLREPLFIAAFLLLLLSLILCIKRTQLLSLKQAVGGAVAGMFALFLILLARSTMWEIVIVITITGALLCFLTQLMERSFNLQKTIAILLICLAAFALPKIMVGRTVTDRAERLMYSRASVEPASSAPWTRKTRQIGLIRKGFVRAYKSAGSNLDTDVQINGVGDAVRYLPRAMAIGLFAPFPRMWFTPGVKVGLTGRVVTGVEMLGLYLMFALACLNVFRERRNLLVWFLFGGSVFASLALAYVVENVGALYRMRYPYYIPIILLAVASLSSLRKKLPDETPLT
jgi:putative peptidoglycan lipid II flippase